jgi:hypothetical protein
LKTPTKKKAKGVKKKAAGKPKTGTSGTAINKNAGGRMQIWVQARWFARVGENDTQVDKAPFERRRIFA